MILLALLGLAISYGIMMYVRNKQRNRIAHRRERFEEKQEELLESLRRKKEEENSNTGNEPHS
jgi:hypothetical protein